MQVLPRTTSERFMHGFWGLRQAMLCRINPRLKAEQGLELIELMLLHHIAASDMSPSELAEAMQIPAHAISRKLDTLERAGLIARSLDKEDARRRVLALTESGQERLEAAGKTLQREIETMLEVLGEQELERFLQALETIARPPIARPPQEKR